MTSHIPLLSDAAASLGIALVVSSNTPLVLLSKDLKVVAASVSFCRQFGLAAGDVVDRSLFDLGNGEWNIAQLRSLLQATVSGNAAIDAYECDLRREGKPDIKLVVHAHKLELPGQGDVYIVLALADVTAMRQTEKITEELLRQKHNLMLELQHRVANSLQIIASVLMQSARRVQSEEASTHIQDAHHRVMSIATLQRLLAAHGDQEVGLAPYLTDLCASIGASMIANPAKLRLSATCDDSRMSADQSVSIGLIVTELVINALKHAFPRIDPEGAIAVRYHSDGEGWVLTVDDNGIGMPHPSSKVQPGLGTGIVEALATQLRATILVCGANPGTLITLTHASDNNSQPSRLV
jgi:two-component system, sensor histidine kinase PdtaS